MEDEAFFIHDVKSGRKYWSPVGVPITVPYTGSHKRITAYGSITMDGRQFFRTASGFNAPTFVAYLKAMQRHFGKVAVMVDRVHSWVNFVQTTDPNRMVIQTRCEKPG